MAVDTHERLLAAPPAAVGRLDRPLSVGACGGCHGPVVRYHVEAYSAGSAIRFQFDRPPGFHGHNEYVVTPRSSGTLLRHSLVMRTSGIARLTWPLVFRPLHDPLIEDSLDQASKIFGLPISQRRRWNRRVRVLRLIARWLAIGARWREAQRTRP